MYVLNTKMQSYNIPFPVDTAAKIVEQQMLTYTTVDNLKDGYGANIDLQKVEDSKQTTGYYMSAIGSFLTFIKQTLNRDPKLLDFLK